MQIYPAIDLKDGKCVRLLQGDFDKETVYSDDPVKMAESFASAGAAFIHIVDLDGARSGTSKNAEVIRCIAERLPMKVQTGGGIRNMQNIEDKINMGVFRVILGTAAVENPALVKEAVQRFGDKIAVGVDCKNKLVAKSGWEQVSEVNVFDFVGLMESYLVKTVILTDIAKDGMMEGVNTTLTKEVIASTKMDVIASGGVSSLQDLEKINAIHAKGVIIGKALYTKAVDLKEVVEKFEKQRTIH